MRLIVIVFSFFIACGLHAGEHQEFLMKKSMLFDGWQDEGLLELKTEIPSYPRMSTVELHRRVEQAVAIAQECKDQKRTVSSEDLPEKCFKTLKDW